MNVELRQKHGSEMGKGKNESKSGVNSSLPVAEPFVVN